MTLEVGTGFSARYDDVSGPGSDARDATCRAP